MLQRIYTPDRKRRESSPLSFIHPMLALLTCNFLSDPLRLGSVAR